MKTREITKAYRLSQWSQALQERAATGESIQAFCQSREISRNTYFYWQRKLREAACGKLPNLEEAEEKALVPSGWAVCGLKETAATLEEQAEAASHTVTVEIGKCRVEVTAGTDPGLLTKVCRLLASLC
jgi:putative transposase